jgi:hypothetical protein
MVEELRTTQFQEKKGRNNCHTILQQSFFHGGNTFFCLILRDKQGPTGWKLQGFVLAIWGTSLLFYPKNKMRCLSS